MILRPETPCHSAYLQRQEWLHMTPMLHEDLRDWYKWRNNPNIYQFMGGRAYREYASLSQVLSSDWGLGWVHENEQLHMYALRTEDQTLIGSMSVKIPDKKYGIAHWGESVIGPDNLRGTGFGTIAKRLLLTHLFETLFVQTVRTEVCKGSVASLRFNLRQGAIITRTSVDNVHTLDFSAPKKIPVP